jgi:hypothetical protein
LPCCRLIGAVAAVGADVVAMAGLRVAVGVEPECRRIAVACRFFCADKIRCWTRPDLFYSDGIQEAVDFGNKLRVVTVLLRGVTSVLFQRRCVKARLRVKVAICQVLLTVRTVLMARTVQLVQGVWPMLTVQAEQMTWSI